VKQQIHPNAKKSCKNSTNQKNPSETACPNAVKFHVSEKGKYDRFN